jgi:hypothetical protein
LKVLPSSQIVLKDYWKKLPSGGEVMEYRIDEMGEDLLETPELHEISPGVQFYLRNPMKPYIYTPHTFHHTVDYNMIVHYHQKNRIWKRKHSPSM